MPKSRTHTTLRHPHQDRDAVLHKVRKMKLTLNALTPTAAFQFHYISISLFSPVCASIAYMQLTMTAAEGLPLKELLF